MALPLPFSPRLSCLTLTPSSPLRIYGTSTIETLTDVQYRPPGINFDLYAFVRSKADSINAALDAALPLRQPFSIHKAMRYSLLSEGKRVCPILCICSCELLGGSQDLAMPTACALEMLHAASLIHGDLPSMDDDDLRRGHLATHRLFGEHLALLSADAMYAFAMEHVAAATKGVTADIVLSVIRELCKAVGFEGIVAGQFLDLQAQSDSDIDMANLEEIHKRKIGTLAECSLACGAILGGGREEQINRLRCYGQTLGILYQVIEDVLHSRKALEEEHVRRPRRHRFAKYLGVEKCEHLVQELRDRAKSSIETFGRKEAIPLLCIVDFLADLV